MPGLQANWHLADLELDDSDPLDIRMVAKPIDLTGDTALLESELRASLRIEARKYDEGLYCELKLSEDWPTTWSCRTCPHRTENMDDPMAVICRMSLRQIELAEQITMQRAGGEDAVLAALADAHGDWALWEATDLAEAHSEWAMTDAVCV